MYVDMETKMGKISGLWKIHGAPAVENLVILELLEIKICAESAPCQLLRIEHLKLLQERACL